MWSDVCESKHYDVSSHVSHISLQNISGRTLSQVVHLQLENKSRVQSTEDTEELLRRAEEFPE